MRQTTPNILDDVLAIGPAVAAVPPGQPLQRRCAELRPHPLNETIYGDRADGDLIESIRQRGVLNPILITGDNLIVSGHRRWGAAIAAGLETVPVVVYTGDDSLDIEEALIESNRQRSKTNEQIGREYKRLKEIYNERASRQGQRTDRTSVSQDTEVAAKPSEQAATELGVSRMTAYRIETVVDRIDELQAAGQPAEAAELRDTLNRSARTAYQQVRPARMELFEIEQVVRRVATAERATASDLRVVARQRIGRVWLECRKQLPAELPYRDLAQAINNVAEQMAQRATAPVPTTTIAPTVAYVLPADNDLHTGAGRTPPPPLTVAEIVEELTPHLAGFAPGNIAGAALGEQNDVAERCALVLSDFTYQQADLRRALQRISNDRHLAMTKEASAAVANVDRPLPAWAAEPEAQEPATVEQTVADVVEVHGEPAPVAEPEATDFAQQVDDLIRRTAAKWRAKQDDLRFAAKQQSGRIWQDCVEALPDVPADDLGFALNELARQMDPQAAAATRPAHLDDRDWELRKLEEQIDRLLASLKQIEKPFGDLTGLHTQAATARHGLESMRRTVRSNLGIND